jgi:hypothetical protein
MVFAPEAVAAHPGVLTMNRCRPSQRGRMMRHESFCSVHQFWRRIMEMKDDEIHVSTEEARGAVTQHGVRYVLLISLALAVVALSAIWMTGTLRG